jgi:hypothetical protein
MGRVNSEAKGDLPHEASIHCSGCPEQDTRVSTWANKRVISNEGHDVKGEQRGKKGSAA